MAPKTIPVTDHPGVLIENRWDAATVSRLSAEQLLLYRSNLLGSDKRVTNFGGGNTSAKIETADPLTGRPIEVLWVKGSGGDLGSMKLDGFATLYMEKLLAVAPRFRGPQDEDAMVGLYPHCAFNLNSRAASIDTPLHGLIDRKHVDHMHPDAVIAIAACADGERITQEIYGDEIGWLPWLRPGFALGLQLQKFVHEHPRAKGVMLESHGVFTWGDTSKECYENTLDVINRAITWLTERQAGLRGFGVARFASQPAARRREIAGRIMPHLRGLISRERPKIGHFDDSIEVLHFVNSEALQKLATVGTSCPDHFLRTKIRPLVLEFNPTSESEAQLIARLPAAIEAYRAGYRAYYERCKKADSPAMRDCNPVVYLIPGVGMITFAPDKATARIAAEFYLNAINVMREASGVSTYRGLPEQEAFDIEYWKLEEAKLQRMPKPKALAGRVALVTGGAGGIGVATARRLADDGAAVILCDIDRKALSESESELHKQYGDDVIASAWIDVTDEDAVESAFLEAAWRYGGVDICVSNAGIASASTIEETTVAVWDRNLDILAKGYFLVSRSVVRMLKVQGLGGSVIFIGSKNALAASPGAAAYCTAKAAEIHLARCLALELASAEIRVNVVNPDAVLRGSRIWQGEWAEQRAQQNNTTTGNLEAVYRERSLLKRSVFPEDVAEAVAFFATERSSKSTGNIINVDAGNAAAFTR